MLDCLIMLDKANDYVPGTSAEVTVLIHETKVVADQVKPKGAEAIDLSYIHHNMLGAGPHQPQYVQSISSDALRPFSGLPEIPLPVFEGDLQLWPIF